MKTPQPITPALLTRRGLDGLVTIGRNLYVWQWTP